eukprot:3142954-Pyramimonas_sp.AAC.1
MSHGGLITAAHGSRSFQDRTTMTQEALTSQLRRPTRAPGRSRTGPGERSTASNCPPRRPRSCPGGLRREAAQEVEY